MNKLYIGLLIVFAACTSGKKNNEDSGKINVLCTTGIIANAYDSILPKSNFKIDALMGPGTDPHLYKPTPRDISLLQNADVIIANGLHLEGKMTDILEKLQSSKKVIFISDALPENQLIEVASKVYDPHIWFNPDLWSIGIGAGADSCLKWFDCDKNALSKGKLNWQLMANELTYDLENKFVKVEKNKRVFVTAHDAFSYYSKRFNIELRALQGISTQSEFGLKDISDLADFVVEKNVKMVYFESSVPKKSVEALKSACSAKNHSIQIDGPLYSDALGAKNSKAANYFDMLRYNSEKIIGGMLQ